MSATLRVFVTCVLLLCITGSAGANAQSRNLEPIQTASSDSGSAKPERPTAKPDAFDPNACVLYLDGLRPGFRAGLQNIGPSSGTWATPVERLVWRRLCNGLPARAGDTVNLARTLNREIDQPKIRGELIRAIFDSDQFDFPGFDKIIIEGYEIVGSVALSKTKINNFVSLRDCIFDGLVDLSYVSTEHNIDLTNSEFREGLSLRGFKSTQSLLIDPTIDAGLGEAPLPPVPPQRKTAKFIDLDLSHVDGVVAIGNLRASYLDAAGATAGQYFRISHSQFGRVSLLNLSAGSVNVLDTTVTMLPWPPFPAVWCPADTIPSARMGGLKISDSVALERSEFPCGIDLGSAKIGGDLRIRGDVFSSLDLTGASVGGDLVGGLAAFYPSGGADSNSPQEFAETRWIAPRRLVLDHAQVDLLRVPVNTWFGIGQTGSGTDPARATAAIVAGRPAGRDGARVVDPEPAEPGNHTVPCTQLGPTPEGGGNPVLTLIERFLNFFKELAVGPKLYSSDPTKPGAAVVSANGLSFRTFGEPDYCHPTDQIGRSLSSTIPLSVIEAFLLSISYSAAEFDRVSTLLRDRGQESDARQVEVWKSEIERNNRAASLLNSSSFSFMNLLSAVFATLSGFLVGFGYHVEYSFIWAAILVFVGRCIFARLRLSGDAPQISGKPNVDYSDIAPFAYSFDTLIPIVKLREKHYEIDILDPRARRYFYFHKAMGYVLGIYMFAGLTGLAR